MNRTSAIGAAAVCLSMFGWTESAFADTACSSLPNTVVIAGSTAVKSLVQAVGAKLARATGDDLITIVYQGKGSCAGVQVIGADTDPTGACTDASCVKGTADYYDTTYDPTVMGAKPPTCDLDPNGTHVDIAFSDVYKESCDGVSNPNLRDQSMVVLPFGFVVPKASSQEAIDAREAYYVYGKGMAANVTPWTNPAAVFQRDSTSGTQITMFKNIHIPIASQLGTTANPNSTDGVATSVAAVTNAEQGLGIAGLDAVDLKYRGSLDVLAYRHWGQKKFYWGDSTPTSYDKKNIRDGHYPLWGYEHGVYLVDGSGNPLKPRAKKLADILSGAVALPGGDVVVEAAKVSIIPTCAMEVSRMTDGGDFSAYTPAEPCTCAFEKNVTQGSTSCKACTADTDCSAGQKCRHNYCEAH